jgi:hypothetical protein
MKAGHAGKVMSSTAQNNAKNVDVKSRAHEQYARH